MKNLNINLEGLAEKVQDVISVYSLKILGAILIFVIGIWVSRIVRKLFSKLVSKAKVDITLAKFVEKLIYYALLTFVIIAALSQLGIQTTSFIAVLGAAGLAVGLAMKDSLSNFSAGVMLLVFRPFKVGDFIEGAGIQGSVEEIQIFTTRLSSIDNKDIVVPNSKLMGDNIVNYTANENRRLDLVFGVGYGDDLQKTRAILEDILDNEAMVLKEPKYTIGVLELADSSVNFAVRPWVNTSDYWNLRFKLNETVKKRFDEEGISIPFPQRDVHLYQK